MSKAVKKDFALIIYFMLISMLMEIVIFLFLGFGLGPKYILFDVAFLVGVGLFLLILPNIVKIIVCTIILLVQAVLGGVNAALNFANGDIFYLETIRNVKDGLNVASLEVFDIPAIFCLVTIVIVGVAGFIYIEKNYKVEEKINHSIVPLAILMAFSTPCGLGLNDLAYATINNRNYDISDWQGRPLTKAVTMSDIETANKKISDEQYLYDNLNSRLLALKKFGTFGFYLKDLTNLIIDREEQINNEEIKKTINYINNGTFGNVHMGTSEGNNVITILLESVQWFAIDPYCTPNLYALSASAGDTYLSEINSPLLDKMANNSVKLTNYNSRNSTNVSEQYMMVGSFPYATAGYYNMYSENVSTMNFDYSLPNTLKATSNTPMVTSYLHPGADYMFFRYLTIENFGYDNVYLIEDMPEFDYLKPYDFYNFALDSEFMTTQMDKIIDLEDRFYTHLTTINTHGSYLTKDPRHAEKIKPYIDQLLLDWDKVMDYNKTAMPHLNFPERDDSDFYTEYINIKGATMDLDKAIGILFEALETNNLMDNTTVVLYGDHYAYYNDLTLQVYGYGHNDFAHPEIYKIPAFIYDTKLATALKNGGQGIVVDDFTTPASLVPTVLDILNVPFNDSYYLGVSIFDENSKYNAQIASLNGYFDENYFAFDIFNIDGTTLPKEKDTEKLRNEFYCNMLFVLAKSHYIDNMYQYNQIIFPIK